MDNVLFVARAFRMCPKRAQLNPRPLVLLCYEGIADGLLLLCLVGMGIDRADVRWVPWLVG